MKVYANLKTSLRADALAAWNPEIKAAATGDATISIFDTIGSDLWEEGFTAKRCAAALRSIGAGRDVIVNINSPGGDYFEGLAIYNLLKQHEANVTVNVVGLAASAASVIAMAGDTVNVGQNAFLMIHNAWGRVVGNRHDLSSLVSDMEQFDEQMAKLYAQKSGKELDKVHDWMDAETFLSGEACVEAGLADGFLSSDEVEAMTGVEAQSREEFKAVVVLENSLMTTNPDMTRKERRALLGNAKSGKLRAAGDGTPGAADDLKPGAEDVNVDLTSLIDALKI